MRSIIKEIEATKVNEKTKLIIQKSTTNEAKLIALLRQVNSSKKALQVARVVRDLEMPFSKKEVYYNRIFGKLSRVLKTEYYHEFLQHLKSEELVSELAAEVTLRSILEQEKEQDE